MTELPKITWNGFLRSCVDRGNAGREIAGFLFSHHPYRQDEVWHVMQVKTRGLRGSDPSYSWEPDRRDMQSIKKQASNAEWVKLGNIHTHPLTKAHEKEYHADMIAFSRPSPTDLKYARKFNDVVRGVIAVDYRYASSDPQILSILFHDKYGNNIYNLGELEIILALRSDLL